jgi:hypothetical protein
MVKVLGAPPIVNSPNEPDVLGALPRDKLLAKASAPTICAVPPLSIAALVAAPGTPAVQFPALNHDPVPPCQLLADAPAAGRRKQIAEIIRCVAFEQYARLIRLLDF